MIRDDGLCNYADLLQANGFSIYEPKGSADYFMYSRQVDGRECFGYVQKDYFGSYSHTMPIRPSHKHGSSMFVGGVADELTVAVARLVARPRNSNRLVGLQHNYEDSLWIERGYTRRGARPAEEVQA